MKCICNYNKVLKFTTVYAAPLHTKGTSRHWFKPGRGRWIFSERKNSKYDFLRKGNRAVS